MNVSHRPTGSGEVPLERRSRGERSFGINRHSTRHYKSRGGASETFVSGINLSEPIQILLIEDSPGDILLIRQLLAKEPYQISIRVALDGEQAAEILAAPQFKPHLVILDLEIPKRSGFSVLEGSHPDLPFVVFTVSNNPQDRQRSFDLGVKDFVQKPTDLGEYRQAVLRMVRSYGRSKDAPAGAG
jgi:CheY-like chemotaxis protein